MISIIFFLLLLILVQWIHLRLVRAEFEMEREFCDEDVRFYSDAYSELAERVKQ